MTAVMCTYPLDLARARMAGPVVRWSQRRFETKSAEGVLGAGALSSFGLLGAWGLGIVVLSGKKGRLELLGSPSFPAV